MVGAGQMGRWIASLGPWQPTFVDVDHATAQAAAEAADGAVLDPESQRQFDIVCIAVPMSAAAAAVAEYAPRAREAVIDVTGEMRTVLEAMTAHASDRQRASFHPLFAASNAPGNVAVVIDVPGPAITAVIDALEAAGNRVVETTPDEHDQAMQSIQAAAHTAILAYGIARETVPAGFETPISETLDELVMQVTNGNPAVYREIQQQFDGAEMVAAAAARIADADADTFDELYETARLDP